MRDMGLEGEVVKEAAPQEKMGDQVFCESVAGEELGRLLTWGNHPRRKADYDLASPSEICDLLQTLFEPILLAGAASRGTEVRFNTEYVSLEQDEAGVTATVRDRSSGESYEIRAGYLIGADGGRSQVAEDIGLPMEGQMGIAGSMNIDSLDRCAAFALFWIRGANCWPGSRAKVDEGRRAMGLLDGLMGNASEVEVERIEGEFERGMAPGERGEKAYLLIRDLFVFTNKRLLLVDKQGMTGSKIEYHSLPYRSITHFSIETAGHFDLDAELKIWDLRQPDAVPEAIQQEAEYLRGAERARGLRARLVQPVHMILWWGRVRPCARSVGKACPARHQPRICWSFDPTLKYSAG